MYTAFFSRCWFQGRNRIFGVLGGQLAALCISQLMRGQPSAPSNSADDTSFFGFRTSGDRTGSIRPKLPTNPSMLLYFLSSPLLLSFFLLIFTFCSYPLAFSSCFSFLNKPFPYYFTSAP
jgi:hypothetical protein